jgi:hypothetical protein
MAMAGRKILEAAPVSDQTNAFWHTVKNIFAQPIHDKVVYKNDTDRLLMFPSGGSIRCKTAYDADTMRGDYADVLILDEYSMMKPSAWDEVGAPMLLDNDGDAVFIFTPKRRNHAHSLYVNAVGDDTGRWQAWHFASYENPYLSKAALAEIVRDMTQDAYKQEILAEFLSNEGAVFRNIGACMNASLFVQPAEHLGHDIVIGCDWGKYFDYSVFSVGCATCHREIDRDRSNILDYHVQRQRLETLNLKWRPKIILAESNAMGEPIIETLVRDGLPVRGFATTSSSKPPLIENFMLVLEREEWQFQADIIWTAELEAYERTVSASTSRSSYSAPPGVHDDTVIARALMLRAASTFFGSDTLPVVDDNEGIEDVRKSSWR